MRKRVADENRCMRKLAGVKLQCLCNAIIN
jgi:hypothetical protein